MMGTVKRHCQPSRDTARRLFWSISSRNTVIFLGMNVKMTSHQYSKSRWGDQLILRPEWISFTGKMVFLDWIRALVKLTIIWLWDTWCKRCQSLHKPRIDYHKIHYRNELFCNVSCIRSWMPSRNTWQYFTIRKSRRDYVFGLWGYKIFSTKCLHNAERGK